MRSLLFILLLFVSYSVGIEKKWTDSSPDRTQCNHASELSTAYSIDDYSSLLDFGAFEYFASELKVNYGIQNNLSTPHLYIVDTSGKNANFNPKTLFF